MYSFVPNSPKSPKAPIFVLLYTDIRRSQASHGGKSYTDWANFSLYKQCLMRKGFRCSWRLQCILSVVILFIFVQIYFLKSEISSLWVLIRSCLHFLPILYRQNK